MDDARRLENGPRSLGMDGQVTREEQLLRKVSTSVEGLRRPLRRPRESSKRGADEGVPPDLD